MARENLQRAKVEVWDWWAELAAKHPDTTCSMLCGRSVWKMVKATGATSVTTGFCRECFPVGVGRLIIEAVPLAA